MEWFGFWGLDRLIDRAWGRNCWFFYMYVVDTGSFRRDVEVLKKSGTPPPICHTPVGCRAGRWCLGHLGDAAMNPIATALTHSEPCKSETYKKLDGWLSCHPMDDGRG